MDTSSSDLVKVSCRRVSVETAVHQLFRDLTEQSTQNPEAVPFTSMKDVFMWAVALGVRASRRLPLSEAKTQIFRWDQLSQDLDILVLKALTVGLRLLLSPQL